MSATVRIKLVHGTGTSPLPSYETQHAAGMDIRAAIPEPIVINPRDSVMVPTGIAMEIPVGYEGQVRPRSGLAAKHGITVLNAPGTIDSDYRGEIHVILHNASKHRYTVNNNDRIAQIVIAPVEQATIKEVKRLTKTIRSSGGFGSTGKT